MFLNAQVGHRPALNPAPSDAIQYVSTNGNDSNDGLSMGTAKATIQAAINALPSAGGTVRVLSGVFAGTFSITNSLGNRPILIQGNCAERGELSEFNNHLTGDCSTIRNNVNGDTVQINNAVHVTIRGLAFEGSGTGAHIHLIEGGGSASQIYIEGNSFQGKAQAVLGDDTGSFHIYIRDNVMDSQTSQGVSLTSTGGNNMWDVEHNLITNFGSQGISLFSSGATGANSSIKVRDNQISDSSSAGATAIQATSIDNLIIEGNDIENLTDTLGTAMNLNTITSCVVQGNYVGGATAKGVTRGILGTSLSGCLIGPNRSLKRTVGSSSFVILDSGSSNNVVMQQNTDYPGGQLSDSGTYNSFLTGVNANGSGIVKTAGVLHNLSTKSAPYTLTASDSWINVTGTTTITVPHALTGQRWDVFNSGSNTVTLQADSGNINGAASVTLAANTGKSVTCDGTNCFAH